MSVVVCDLDGVVWRGDDPIAGAAEAIVALKAAGRRVGFLTNNSSATVDEYVAKLERVGVAVTGDDVVTSALAAARLLSERYPAGARVVACAGPGVVEAVAERGFEVVECAPAAAVIVGWHRDFDFARLTAAVRAVLAGADLIATNMDPTFPAPDGLLPGNGAIVAAVCAASGAAPIVAGKPEPPIAALVRERFGDRGILVGDRPSTDGRMAEALNWPFAMVLSGVGGPNGEEPIPDPAPAYLAPDLLSLVPQLLGEI